MFSGLRSLYCPKWQCPLHVRKTWRTIEVSSLTYKPLSGMFENNPVAFLAVFQDVQSVFQENIGTSGIPRQRKYNLCHLRLSISTQCWGMQMLSMVLDFPSLELLSSIGVGLHRSLIVCQKCSGILDIQCHIRLVLNFSPKSYEALRRFLDLGAEGETVECPGRHCSRQFDAQGAKAVRSHQRILLPMEHLPQAFSSDYQLFGLLWDDLQE